jgi:hypothetical protein
MLSYGSKFPSWEGKRQIRKYGFWIMPMLVWPIGLACALERACSDISYVFTFGTKHTTAIEREAPHADSAFENAAENGPSC